MRFGVETIRQRSHVIGEHLEVEVVRYIRPRRRSPHRPDENGVVTARHGPAAQPSSIVRWLAMSSSPSSPGRSVNCSVTAVALSFHRKATFTIT